MTSIVHDVCYKRIKRELMNYNYVCNYNSEPNSVLLNFNEKRVIIKMKNYPYKPPKIIINDKALIYCPSVFPIRAWQMYIKLYPGQCPCCKTILCEYNWSPCYGIIQILREYYGLIDKFKIICGILMVGRLQLPDDIIREISSYLL